MTKTFGIGLVSLSLLLCAACSSKQVVAVPQVVHVSPAPHLMEPTPEPSCAPDTNADLLGCALDYRDALRRANADKAAIKASVLLGGKQ